MTEQIAASSDPSRWALLLSLLSMDCFVAFADLMGFPVPQSADLMSVLRKLIIGKRREVHRSGATSAFDPEGVFAAIEPELGGDYAEGVAWWGNRVFAVRHLQYPALYTWTTILRECRHDDLRWLRLGFPQGLQAEARRRFLASINRAPYEERHSAVYGQPLSDWDLHMYAEWPFDDSDDEGTPNGPDTYVRPTIRGWNAFEYWRWVLGALDRAALDRLREGASAQVAEIAELAFVKSIPDPADLELVR